MSYENTYNYGQPYRPAPAVHHYSHPPQPANTTVVVMNQPGAARHLGQPQNIRKWSTGLCGCCEDVPNCCFAFWCYPCFVCTLATKMDENCCGPICCGGGAKCVGMHCSGAPNPFVTAMRTKMRAKHGIEGSICDDVCCTWCCECCVATQLHRELKHVGRI